MADLFWPGDERAGDVFSSATFLADLVRVEQAWSDALVAAGVAPVSADLSGLVDEDDLETISAAAEAGGNPVIPLVALLRDRTEPAEAAAWLHRGLTSQDVLDTALVLGIRRSAARLGDSLDGQAATLARLADLHRDSVMCGRTLTQHAVPITFGLKAAGWLAGVLDAGEQVAALETPAQLGGAAGTMAATVALARSAGAADPVATALQITDDTAARLGLAAATPWHGRRTPVTRAGDAFVTATDAFGRIADDVLTLSRPEIGELREGRGGGSSTMPHKANPVLSTLVRRAALAGPGLAAQLHLAAADTVDERTPGGWHLEWSTLATLARRTLVAAAQCGELLDGLQVDPERMAATAAVAADDLLAEARSLGVTANSPASSLGSYLGAHHHLIDVVLARHRPRKARP